MKYKTGDRVFLKEEALSISYIQSRKSYTNMYKYKRGKVLGYSGTGKVMVEFDDIVFTRPNGVVSSHDNGCHNSGKKMYSWYIPEFVLMNTEQYNKQLINESFENINKEYDNIIIDNTLEENLLLASI